MLNDSMTSSYPTLLDMLFLEIDGRQYHKALLARLVIILRVKMVAIVKQTRRVTWVTLVMTDSPETSSHKSNLGSYIRSKWGVSQESRDWNVGALYVSEEKATGASNLALFFKVPILIVPGAFSQGTLNQIKF